MPPLINKDEENLNLLATFHYVLGALGALFACFPLIHVAVGLLMVTRPEIMAGGQRGTPPPLWFGYVFIVMGGLFVLFGWAAAICAIVSGRCLAKRRRRMFSFVVAAVLCLFTPLGTILGVFTIIALSKDSVQRLYEKAPNPSLEPTPTTVTPVAEQPPRQQ